MPTWLLLLALPLLGRKRGAAAPAFTPDPDSMLARFTAGATTASIYSRPRPSWRVIQESSDSEEIFVLAQGTGKNIAEIMRPMLEAFAEATTGRSISAYMFDRDRWLTIFVAPANADASSWAWSITDGVQSVNGTPEDSRGRALLAAIARVNEGG